MLMTEAIRTQVEGLLKEKGLSKAALGRELGMHREQIARLFTLEGNQIPPTWGKIFEYLGLELTVQPSLNEEINDDSAKS